MADAVTGLLGETTRSLREYAMRYLLLVRAPEKFYDRHIKNKGKKELKRAILDALAAAALLTSFVSLFLYIPELKQLLPPTVLSILSNERAILAIIIAFSLPTFSIIAFGLKLMGAKFQDSVFIYFHCLTLFLLAVLFAIVLGIFFQAAALALLFYFGAVSVGNGMASFSDPVTMLYILVVGVFFSGSLAILFYAPSRLIERSARSSAFAAAMLTIVSVMVPATAAAYGLTLYAHAMMPALEFPAYEPPQPSEQR